MRSLQLTVIVALAIVVSAHEELNSDQIPLGYVKYPYQATYPGDGEGLSTLAYIGLSISPCDRELQSQPTPSSLALLLLQSCLGFSV